MFPGLDCVELAKQFGHQKAVDHVSFRVETGSFFSILGPSGCGKTTLLRMIAGFLQPDHGKILINSESIIELPPNKRPVNMVFQHLALFPTMSVFDNIAYGLRRKKVNENKIAQKVTNILERIELPGIEHKTINQLSGGQKQRIAIARCLVLEPKLLLLDEPLGALDLKLREQMKLELKQLQNQFGTTFVYITHDQSEALVMSDHIAVMNNGCFEQIGTPQELYHQPKTPFVAHFVGEANCWQAQVVQRHSEHTQLKTHDGFSVYAAHNALLQDNSSAEVFVRPEHMVIAKEYDALSNYENKLEGRVSSVLFNGSNSQLVIKEIQKNKLITVALPNTGSLSRIKAETPVYIGWRQRDTHVFPL